MSVALHHPLTGLPARLLMQDRLIKALQQAAKQGRQVGLIRVEIDPTAVHQLNSAHGRSRGDQAIKEIARRLTSSVRALDTVAHEDGVHFVAILPDVSDVATTVQAAERIFCICSEPITLQDGLEFELPVFIGAANFPEHGYTATDLLKNSNLALLQAKKGEQLECICVYSEDGKNKFERLQKEQQLLSVLSSRSLLVHYQPKIEMSTNAVIGAEALMRWSCSRTGMVRGPDGLIPIAEELRLIDRITENTVRESIHQAAIWRKANLNLAVAINIPPEGFTEDLVALVAECLTEYDLPAHLLELEITESALIGTMQEAARVMEKFVAMGISLALDDFGTGYSTFEKLKMFPATCLKIDRAFVRNIQETEVVNNKEVPTVRARKDIAIIESMVSLAKQLNLTTVAEGIELESQLKLLQQLGIDYWQGFYASKALSASDFDRWLQSRAE